MFHHSLTWHHCVGINTNIEGQSADLHIDTTDSPYLSSSYIQFSSFVKNTLDFWGTQTGLTHSARDALDLASTEWLKVHADVSLHGCEQLLGGAVSGVGLLPPVSLVPARDNPLVFTSKHVQVICLWELGEMDIEAMEQQRDLLRYLARICRQGFFRTWFVDVGSSAKLKSKLEVMGAQYQVFAFPVITNWHADLNVCTHVKKYQIFVTVFLNSFNAWRFLQGSVWIWVQASSVVCHVTISDLSLCVYFTQCSKIDEPRKIGRGIKYEVERVKNNWASNIWANMKQEIFSYIYYTSNLSQVIFSIAVTNAAVFISTPYLAQKRVNIL